jgi:curved DNA-binding protein CbpA
MDKQEAYRILGIKKGDKLRDVRRKYHLLMHEHHPDSSPDNKSDTAKKLNEAFAIIKREGISSKYQIRDWGIAENKNAFCERKLYMEDTLFGDEIVVDTGGYGKFYWEPDMESFRMLLKSLGEAVKEILEEKMEGSSDRSDGTIQTVKAKLLHLLIQEFVDPYECIKLLYPYEDKGDGSLLTCVKCQIKPESPGDLGKIRDTEPIINAQGSKLYVFAGNDRAGQIVFDEDRLYYLVTPLFLQKAAEVTLEIKEIAKTRRKQHYISADMILKIDPSKKMDMTDKINEEIIRMLGKI